MLARLFVVMCLAGMIVGCGGDSTRGVNRDRDRPRAGSEKDKEKVEKK